MDGAAVFLLLSSVGVSFGWQPMPDGSPRHEYIVQVDPELVATLAEGRTIPIVSDIPEEIQPIGRIRLTVGRGELPRQRAVTRLKPATAGAPAAENQPVALAQYNQYADPRYGASAPQPTLANSDAGASATAPTGQSQLSSSEAPATQWNGADQAPVAAVSAPTTGQQLFGGSPGVSGAGWNGGGALHDAATNVANGAISRAQEGVQNAAQQVGQELRSSIDELGDRTNRLVNELGQPFARQQTPNPSATGAGQSWNGETGSANHNPLRTEASDAGASWNNGPQANTSPGSATDLPSAAGQGAAVTAPPISASNSSPWTDATQSTRPSSPPAATAGSNWNGGAAAAPADRSPYGTASSTDPWASVADPILRSNGPVAASGNPPELASRPSTFGGAGASTDTPQPQYQGASQPAQSPPTTSSLPTGPQNSQMPSVSRGMLAQPGDRPLDGGSVAQQPLDPSTQPAGLPQTPVSGDSGKLANGWNFTVPTNGDAPTPASSTPTAASKDNAALVLAAWVLLTGSVAGNFYLFWSYLDVRQKYRTLVRKTARAVGSRFSAA